MVGPWREAARRLRALALLLGRGLHLALLEGVGGLAGALWLREAGHSLGAASVELETQDLLGRDLDVELVTEEGENPSTGRRQRRNRVPYEGFAARGSANTRIGSEGSEEPAPLREGACPQEAWPP